MSNSLRHRDRRQRRAKQKQYENRMKRNALRNKQRALTQEPVSLDVIKEERRRRRSLWQKVKEYFNETVKSKFKGRKR